jgi:endonuclease/exonuclease/phosphatase (EEP) superfamily protein YafD
VRGGGKLPQADANLQRLSIDTALLQEADGEADWAPAQVFHRQRISQKRKWVSGIVAHRGRLSALTTVTTEGAIWELHRANPGSVAVAEYDPGDCEPITLIGLYGVMENRWSYPTLLRQLADLSPLLYSRRKQRLLLGGDFNAGAINLPAWASIYRPLRGTLEAFGLTDLTRYTAKRRAPAVDCPCLAAPDCGHLPTQRPRTGIQGFQVENIWCSAPLLKQFEDLEVGDTPFDLSDHRPLIATFRCGTRN